MKHAYCIIAHNEPIVLQKLIETLDDDRNDIYLLIDKKTDRTIFSNVKTHKSKLIYVSQIDIRWGDISLIKAELILFETASQHERYQYYHLLSGVDLPIKSQDYIHDFMNKNNGKEFVEYSQGKINEHDLQRKTTYYYLFTKYYRNKSLVSKLLTKASSKLVQLQRELGYKRNFDIELKKGVNWISITHEFCTYLLTKKEYILKTFKYIPCADEMFVQTILWQSPFRKNLYRPDCIFDNCLREIDWERGEPYIWGIQKENINKDIQILKNSPKLFARKFSSKNMDFINQILKLSKNKY